VPLVTISMMRPEMPSTRMHKLMRCVVAGTVARRNTSIPMDITMLRNITFGNGHKITKVWTVWNNVKLCMI
jgi:hypothetical protein